LSELRDKRKVSIEGFLGVGIGIKIGIAMETGPSGVDIDL